MKPHWYFFLFSRRYDYCLKLTGESAAQGERIGDVSWRCLLSEKISWNKVAISLIDENYLTY